jgi:eukaryotic-like serine/threonine-protein kinase
MPDDPTSDAADLLGGRYRLDRRIDEGGMAEVWVATDTQLGRTVAVKILKERLAADPVIAERFRREAVAAASLSHPNVVAVYDAVDDAGRQAVVMQYVPGQSLRRYLDEVETLTVDNTIRIGEAVAEALDAAHQAGMVHRDVKPGNILLTPDGRVLLADFGIAKAIDGNDGHDLTSDNIMMGTAKYLSPEQVRGRRLDGRADLYSLGLVLYECLAGHVPFVGESDADTALARLQRDATPVGHLRPNIPQPLVDIVHRLIAREPEQRPESGAVVVDALRHARTVRRDATPVAPGGPLADDPTRVVPSPVTSPVASSRPDPTPEAPRTVTARPPQHVRPRTGGPLLVVGGLLAAAVVTAVVLFLSMRTPEGSEGGATPITPVTATTDPASTDAGSEPTPGPDPGAGAVITTLRSFDPNGDGTENDDALGTLVDDDPTTAWTTLCYKDRYLGGKQGVGVVAELDPHGAPADVEIEIDSGPWQVKVYVAAELHADLEEWGPHVASDFAAEPRLMRLELERTDRFLLVWMNELGEGGPCSADNPYQGRISRLTVTPKA